MKTKRYLLIKLTCLISQESHDGTKTYVRHQKTTREKGRNEWYAYF